MFAMVDTSVDSAAAATTGVAYPRLYEKSSAVPRRGLPDEDTTAKSDVSTGDEHGDATTAVVAPTRKARKLPLPSAALTVSSKFREGKLNLTMSSRLRPISRIRSPVHDVIISPIQELDDPRFEAP